MNLRTERESSTSVWSDALSDWGGSALFNGAVASVACPAETVMGLLPKPLTLAPAAGVAHDRIIMIFGEVVNGGAHLARRDVAGGARYREIAVMIANVRHPDLDGPAAFAYQMFADSILPILIGNSVYGYRKELVRVDCAGPKFEASRDGRVLFQSSNAWRGPWGAGRAAADPNLESVRTAFAGPIVGRLSSGQYVESRFDWGFENSEICKLSADVAWQTPTEMHRFTIARGFGVRGLRWRTSPPRWLCGTSVS